MNSSQNEAQTGAAATPPARLLSEIIDPNEPASGCCMSRHSGPADYKDSIEVSRNAKGEYAWKIKEYHAPGAEAAEIAASDIAAIDARLRAQYTKEA